MKRLYYVRHGESVMNTQGLCSGYTDTPLTQTGVQQAIRAGKAAQAEKIHFDAILSSPLQRARDTANIVATEIGFPNSDIKFLDNLQERGFGILEGKNMTDVLGISTEYYFANPRCIDDVEGVEALAQLHKRAEDVLEYVNTLPNDSVLLVGHGAFLRSLQRVIKNLPIDEPIDLIANAQIIKLI